MQEICDAQKYKSIFVEATEEKSLAALLYPHLRQLILALDRMENLNERVKRALLCS